MGLKEKALQFEKEVYMGGEEASVVIEAEHDFRTPEQILADKQANPPELNKDLSQDPFLSSDDLHSSSRPVIDGLAQHAQIESLFSLIELSKELSSSQSEAELWDTVLFTLIGQLGVKEVAIFIKEENRFVLKKTQGFVIKNSFQVPLDSSLLKSLSQENGIIYTNKLIPHLKPLEKVWFGALNSDLLIPVLNYEQIVGFIILGKTIGQMDYNLEDLIYIKILGELLGSFHHSVQKLIQISKHEVKVRNQVSNYNILDQYTKMIQKAQDFSEIDRIFLELITDEYQVSKFIFLLRQGKQFLPNLYKNIDEKTIKKIKTSARESWVIEMKNQSGWYEYTNYLENTNFTKKFSAEDLSLITKVSILPIYFSNEIEGIFILLDISHDVSVESLSYLGVIINTYYWSFLAYKSKASGVGSLEDPLFDFRALVHDYENDLNIKKIPYSLVYLTVENASRLGKLNSKKFIDNQKKYLKITLNSMISEKEKCFEIFPSKFFLILIGEGSKKSQYIFKNLAEAIKLEYKTEKSRPIIRCKTLSRPEQKAISLHSFLFD